MLDKILDCLIAKLFCPFVTSTCVWVSSFQVQGAVIIWKENQLLSNNMVGRIPYVLAYQFNWQGDKKDDVPGASSFYSFQVFIPLSSIKVYRCHHTSWQVQNHRSLPYVLDRSSLSRKGSNHQRPVRWDSDKSKFSNIRRRKFFFWNVVPPNGDTVSIKISEYISNLQPGGHTIKIS